MKLHCCPREVLEYLVRVNKGRELMRGNINICDTETCRPIHTTIMSLHAKYHSYINQIACSVINL